VIFLGIFVKVSSHLPYHQLPAERLVVLAQPCHHQHAFTRASSGPGILIINTHLDYHASLQEAGNDEGGIDFHYHQLPAECLVVLAQPRHHQHAFTRASSGPGILNIT